MRVEFDSPWLPRPKRLAWCGWLKQHGIDPNYVALPGWIQRDEQRRRVYYLTFAFDTYGRPVFERGDFVTEPRFVQLEARPLPFPREVLT